MSVSSCSCIFYDYVHIMQLKSKQLNGMLIYVYTMVIHLPYIRNVESTYTKLGLGGLWVSFAHIARLYT